MNTALILTQGTGFGFNKVENYRIALVTFDKLNSSGGFTITDYILPRNPVAPFTRITPDRILKLNATDQDYDIISNIIDQHIQKLQVLRQEATNAISVALEG